MCNMKIFQFRVYRANFPNVKGRRAPSQNCKKIPECYHWSLHGEEDSWHLGCHLYEKRVVIQHKVEVGMCIRQRFKLVYASAQYDQSLSFLPEETLDPLLPRECLLTTLLRLCRWACLSESLIDTHANWYHLLDTRLFNGVRI